MFKDVYDRDYFEKVEGKSKGYDSYGNSWIWQTLPEIIIKEFNPRRVLDIGCAKGYLMKYLRNRSIEADGVDISEYAVANADPSIRPYIMNCDISKRTLYQDDYFDLICSFNLLEHLTIEELKSAVDEIKRICSKDFLFTIDLWSRQDKSHKTIMSREWWNDFFKQNGLLHNLERETILQKYPLFVQTSWEVFCYRKNIYYKKGK